MRDLIAKKFGQLRVIGKSNKHLRPYVRCVCQCGNETDVRVDHLRSGRTKSCGCSRRRTLSAAGFHYAPGTQFARLTIVEQAGTIRKRGPLYRCLCTCGNTILVQGRHLRSGETRSCGCLFKDSRETSNLRHGQSRVHDRTPVYSAYHRQRSLCQTPSMKNYEYYGGRGIEFCFDNFSQFYAEVGDKPGPDYWLMRLNTDGNFEPGNLEWVPRRRQHARK